FKKKETSPPFPKRPPSNRCGNYSLTLHCHSAPGSIAADIRQIGIRHCDPDRDREVPGRETARDDEAQRLLCFPLALLHETSFGGAGQAPTVPVHCFALAGIPLAFFKKLALAAPTSGLPSLLTALLSQDSCANAGPKFRDSTKTASKIRFIISLALHKPRMPQFSLLRR